MGWQEVQEKILQDDKNKWNQPVSGKEPRVLENGAVRGEDFGGLVIVFSFGY